MRVANEKQADLQSCGQETPGTRRRKGRPAMLSAAIRDDLCLAVRVGCFLVDAAALAGVSESALYGWIRRGKREQRGPYRDFVQSVKRALAQGEAKAVAAIRAAAENDWRAAAWLLERRNTRRWGRRRRHETTPIITEEQDRPSDAKPQPEAVACVETLLATIRQRQAAARSEASVA